MVRRPVSVLLMVTVRGGSSRASTRARLTAKARANIGQVAKLAGVSVATVLNVLNNRAGDMHQLVDS